MNVEIRGHVDPSQGRESKTPVQELLDKKWSATSKAERDDIRARIDALLDAQDAADAVEAVQGKAFRAEAARVLERGVGPGKGLDVMQLEEEINQAKDYEDLVKQAMAMVARKSRVDPARIREANQEMADYTPFVLDDETVDATRIPRNVEPSKLSFTADGGQKALDYVMSYSNMSPEDVAAVQDRFKNTRLKPSDLDILKDEMSTVELYKLKQKTERRRLTAEEIADVQRTISLVEIKRKTDVVYPGEGQLKEELRQMLADGSGSEAVAETLDNKERQNRVDYAKWQSVMKIYRPESKFPAYEEIVKAPEAAINKLGRNEFAITDDVNAGGNLIAMELFDRFQSLANSADAIASVRKDLPKIQQEAEKQAAA